MTTVKFLDCTLRDGGYYNNWDFDFDESKKLIKALNESKVDIIEVGYKSPVQENEYFGLYRYCNEKYLDFLSKSDYSKYAFMIDVKEFLIGDELNLVELNKCIKPAENSVFSWVRLATHYATIDTIPAFVSYFEKLGYKVGFNLMGGSLLSMDQIKYGTQIATKSNVEVFYLADSFGSFYPEDVRKLIRFIKSEFNGKIGIHTHDNQGLAYANTLVAIEEGVDFVDGTVTGMGRGAGNLLTEQFLMGMSEKDHNYSYQPQNLTQIIADYVQPMKDTYKWGFNLTYMYSGLNNIHPTYCQKLAESNQFTTTEQALILRDIPKENRSKYSAQVLSSSIKNLVKSELVDDDQANLTLLDLNDINNENCLIVARGKSAERYISIIEEIAKTGVELFECNDTGLLNQIPNRTVFILNQMRIDQLKKKQTPHNANRTIVGFSEVKIENCENLNYYPFKIGQFSIDEKEIVLPEFDAGLYALGIAIKAGFRNIYLAGFDGYDDAETNSIKESMFQSVKAKMDNKVNIQFVTPTKYKTFDHSSIYLI